MNIVSAMKHMFVLTLLLLSIVAQTSAQRNESVREEQAQFTFPKSVKKDRYKVAVLTPMYLDSVDLESNLTHIPKFMMPGLDFYKGVQIAADTLKNAGHQLDIYVFDSKSDYLGVKDLIQTNKLDSMDLIIGNASIADLTLLAEFAKEKQINFVSAVSPADAGQTFNPYFTILQPRLITHVEKIHRSINARFPEDNVVFVHRNITAEINALQYFKQDILHPLPARFAELSLKEDSLSVDQVLKLIDSNYNTTIVLGILDPAITYKYLKILQPAAERFGIKVYCMPTIEASKALGKTDEFPGMPIYYTTSYIIDKITPASLYINREYKKHMGGFTSDIVYKGFESLYFFSGLMRKYGVPFNEHMNDHAYSFITPYKIMPVKEKGKVKYYENKYLYMLRYENGIMTYE
jgi:hypothetical protein